MQRSSTRVLGGVLALILVSACQGAGAQTPPPMEGRAEVLAPRSFGPDEVELARRVVEVGQIANFALALDAATGELTPPPDMTPEEMAERFGRDRDAFELRLAEIYAATYSADELRALEEFYRTPQGASVAARQGANLFALADAATEQSSRAMAPD